MKRIFLTFIVGFFINLITFSSAIGQCNFSCHEAKAFFMPDACSFTFDNDAIQNHLIAGFEGDCSMGDFIVYLFEDNGTPFGAQLANPILNCDHIGTEVRYLIVYPNTGDGCWGSLLVEEEQPCAIVCHDELTIGIDDSCKYTFEEDQLAEIFLLEECPDASLSLSLFLDNKLLPLNLLDCNFIGSTLEYTLKDKVSGSACSGSFLVEELEEEICLPVCKPNASINLPDNCEMTVGQTEIEALFIDGALCPDSQLRLTLYASQADLEIGKAIPNNTLTCAYIGAAAIFQLTDLLTGYTCIGSLAILPPDMEINCQVVCENQLNVGVNSNCEIVFEDDDYGLFLEGTICSDGYYVLFIYANEEDEANNNPIPENVLGAELMGQSFPYKVQEMITGNACSGMLHINNPGIMFSCPDDVSLHCSSDLNDPSVTGTIVNPDLGETASAIDGRIWWGCEPISMEYEDVTTSEGYIERTYELIDVAGNIENCVQKIYVEGDLNQTLSEDDISFPQDIEVACDQANGEYGEPVINSTICAMVEVTHEDQVLSINAIEEWILRTWTVLDYNQYDPTDPSNGGKWVSTQTIKIEDNEGPQISCVPSTVVALSKEGAGSIFVDDLITAISDNCATIQAINVQKIKGTTVTTYADFIPFDCTDAGQQIELRIRATDDLGNVGTCTSSVLVEVEAPTLGAISDETFVCKEDYTQIAGLNNDGEGYPLYFVEIDNPPLNAFGGEDVIVFQGYYANAAAQCNANIYVKNTNVALGDCGIGTLTRTYAIIDAGGNLAQQQQLISIESDTPFGLNNIEFPDDITVHCNDESAYTGEPTIEITGCSAVSLESYDEVLEIGSSKIVTRTWTVVDACQFDNTLGSAGPGYWTHKQRIIYIEGGGLSFSSQSNFNCGDDYTKIPDLTDDANGVPVYYVVEDALPFGEFGSEDMVEFRGYYMNGTATCGAIGVYVKDNVSNLNQCGMGTITRTFFIMDSTGAFSESEQAILIINNDIFTLSDITWPADVTIACDEDGIPTGDPSIENTSCSSVEISFADSEQVFGNTTITYRTWEVRDWCQYNPTTSTNIGYWTYVQQIIRLEEVALSFPDEIALNCSADFTRIPNLTDNETAIPTYYVLLDNEPLNVFGSEDVVNLQGYYEDASGSCVEAIYVKDNLSGLNECSIGTIIRAYSVRANNGESNTEYQFVKIKNTDPFSVTNITWPGNVTIACGATNNDTGEPTLTEAGCMASITVDYTDEIESLLGSTLTTRTWVIIDACRYNTTLALEGPGVWTHTQLISKEEDILPPNIQCLGALSIDVPLGGIVELAATEIDNGSSDACSGIDYLAARRLDDPNSAFAQTVQFSCDDLGNFPIAVELIIYDNAGNSSTCTMSILSTSSISDFVADAFLINSGCISETSGSIDLILANPSENYTFEWTGPNDFTSTKEDLENIAAGEYEVTIRINDGCGQNYSYTVGGSEECVWPGDANNDGLVNHFDLLNIGMSFDSTGAARPNASSAWTGQYAADWIPTFADGLNYKYADSNGDGRVGSADVSILNLHWGETHDFTGSTTAQTASLVDAIPFYVEQDTVTPSSVIELPVILGSSTQIAESIYGVAFSILYDPTFVKKEQVIIDANDSWLGDFGDNLSMVQRNFPTEGRIDIALTRTDGIEVSGIGKICALEVIIEDFVFFYTPGVSDIKLMNFDIENVRVIDFKGEEKPVAPLQTTSIIEEELVDNILEVDDTELVQVFPNPAQDVVHIQSDQTAIDRLEVYTINGQLLQQQIINSKQASIDVSPFKEGIYVFKIYAQQNIFVQRIILQK